MNNFHFRKIKQLKDWERDLSAVLVFKDDMDEETKNDTRLYRDLLAYAIRQAERVEELEDLSEHHLKMLKYCSDARKKYHRQNKRYREALEEIARGRFPGASYKARKALEDEE